MDAKTFLRENAWKIAVWGLAAAVILLFAFRTGVSVGYRKALFSYRWKENYHRNFGGPKGCFDADFGGRGFIDAHGVFGQIIKSEPPTIVIKDRGDVEKIILTDGAVIKRFRDNLRPEDLRVDEYVVVIGEPDEAGRINAKFIRLLPPPPAPRPF